MSKKTGNAFWKISGGVVGLLAVLAILVAGNVLIGMMRMRADFTGEKLYTLSDGSKAILKKIDQPVTLKFFFSRSLPDVPPYIKNYADEIEDLLKEYSIASGGKITVEKYDPQPDSEAEDWAQHYGLSGQPLDMFGGSAVYCGLVAVMGDKEAALPSLDPQAESTLEYGITRLVYRIGHPEKPAVGVMSSLNVLGRQAPPFAMPGQPRMQSIPRWAVFQDLSEDYDLREVPTTVDRIDESIKSLIVVHPKDLPDSALYAIDQFVLRGGRLLAFVDPMCVVDAETAGASPFSMPKLSSDMKPLFDAWGVDYDAGKVVGDYRAASRVRVGEGRAEESPIWLSLTAGNLNRKDILTSQLGSIMIPYAGAVYATATKDITVTPLITTSDSMGASVCFNWEI